MFLVLFLYALWASTFTISKLILEYMPPILFVAIRMIIGGIILLGFQYFFNRKGWRLDWRDFSLFSQITVLFMYISFVTEFVALTDITSAKACLLFNASPFVMAFFAYFMLGDRLTIKQWIGLFIGLVGFIPIILNQTGEEALTYHIGFLSLPELLLIISVITSTYGWILIKKLSERNYSSVMVLGVTMFWGGILSLITSIAIEGRPFLYLPAEGGFGLTPSQYAFAASAFYILLLVLIAHIVCFNLQTHLMQRYSVTFITFAGFTSPLFAALFDRIIFGITAPFAFFITMVFVIIGLYLFYQDELVQREKAL